MKNLPLTIKIWLALSLVSLLLYLIYLLITPFLILDSFTPFLLDPSSKINNRREPPPPPHNLHIRQFVIVENGKVIPGQAQQALPPSLLQEIREHATAQEQSVQEYDYKDTQAEYRYVIRKYIEDNQQLYQISFLRRSDEDNLVQGLLLRMMLYAGFALCISWFASLFIARYLTRPLIKLEQHVKRIAARNWHEPLHVKHNDEFGQLASSIESMRQQLVRQEAAQQSLLQNVSHGLKTPIMVIRSYAQAIKDGIYPKGDLTGSIQVIDEEGVRLEKLVNQLLYLTRLDYLDYLAIHDTQYSTLELHRLIEQTAERLRFQRPEITWDLDLQPINIEGDEDNWRVLIENVLDNHLRYALSQLQVKLAEDKQKNKIIIRFWNDGPKIQPHVLAQLFQPFQKERDGKFGLGLTIAQRIVKMYRGDINIYNDRNGVCSIIKIPN
jgi:two-component system sensor histidine kinase CssS